MELNVLIFILAFIMLFVGIALKLRKCRKSKHAFTGDYRKINPRKYNNIGQRGVLAGDIQGLTHYNDDRDDDDDDDDDEESIAALGDIERMSVMDPNDFISGDIDTEFRQSQLTEGDFLEGGLFGKMFSKRKKAGSKMSQAAFANKAATILGGQQQVKGSKFPNNLVAQKAVAKVINTPGTVEEKEAAIAQITAASAVPGALLNNVDIARIAVTGGTIKIPQTLLKIPGKNLEVAVKLYEAQYPGTSRSISQIATISGLLSFSFAAPSGKEVSKVLALFIRFSASQLSRTDAEISVSISGGKINGVTHPFNGTDRVIIFADGSKETTMVLLPVIEVRERLWVVPFDTPAADPNDLQIDFTGVPENTNVTVRCAGVDSSEWVDYKNMLGLR